MMHPHVKRVQAQTDDGRKVFEYYGLNTSGQLMLSPLNPFDTKPSFGVYFCEITMKWRFKDFGESGIESQGDCIDFVRRKFRLSFAGAVTKICTDLKLK